MGAVLMIIASVPAYIAGGLALLFGASWLTALGVLVGTGVTVAFGLALLAASAANAEADARDETSGARRVNPA